MAHQVGPVEGGIGPKRRKRWSQVENVEQDMARITFQTKKLRMRKRKHKRHMGCLVDEKDEANGGADLCFNGRRRATTKTLGHVILDPWEPYLGGAAIPAPVTRVKKHPGSGCRLELYHVVRMSLVAVHLQGSEESKVVQILLQHHLILSNYNRT